MGIMQATSSAGRRAEWLLDRIRRGQFADLEPFSVDSLRSLEQETVRAYEALPPSRETDRGRVMLLQGRVKLELRNRDEESPRQRAIRKTSGKEVLKLLEDGMRLAKATNALTPGTGYDQRIAAAIHARNECVRAEYARRAHAVLRGIARGQR